MDIDISPQIINNAAHASNKSMSKVSNHEMSETINTESTPASTTTSALTNPLGENIFYPTLYHVMIAGSAC